MLLLLMWGWGDPWEIRLEGWCVGALRIALRAPRGAHEDAHVERCLWRLRGGQRTETAAETGRVSDSDSVDTAVSIYSKIYPVGSVCGSRECSIQRCDPHSSQITSATDLRFYRIGDRDLYDTNYYL